MAQPRDIRLKFLHPKPTAAVAMAIPDGSLSDYLLPLTQYLSAVTSEITTTGSASVSLGVNSVAGSAETTVQGAVKVSTTGSTRRAIGAALGHVVRSTAGRLRPMRGTKSAVLAPPEEEDLEEDDDMSTTHSHVAATSGNESLALQSSSLSSKRPHHLKGYGTVPLGSITPSIGQSQSRRLELDASLKNREPAEHICASNPRETSLSSDVPCSEQGENKATPLDVQGAPESLSPPRPAKSERESSMASLLTPSALFSRFFVLRHRGPTINQPHVDTSHALGVNGVASGNGMGLLTPGAHGVGRGALLVVPMGGEFGDTEPTFVQVDGEGYKVFALRRLELSFCTRARMVTFTGT